MPHTGRQKPALQVWKGLCTVFWNMPRIWQRSQTSIYGKVCDNSCISPLPNVRVCGELITSCSRSTEKSCPPPKGSDPRYYATKTPYSPCHFIALRAWPSFPLERPIHQPPYSSLTATNLSCVFPWSYCRREHGKSLLAGRFPKCRPQEGLLQ